MDLSLQNQGKGGVRPPWFDRMGLPGWALPDRLHANGVPGSEPDFLHLDHSASEASSSLGRIPRQLSDLYEYAIQEGFRRLQMEFFSDYLENSHPKLILRHYQLCLQRLLLGTGRFPKCGYPRLPKVNKQQRRRFREEVMLCLNGESMLRIIERRSWQELQRRAKEPLYEPMAYLMFSQWLDNHGYLDGPPASHASPEPQMSFQWRGPDPALEVSLLYQELRRQDLLHPDLALDDFMAHFSERPAAPISWRGSLVLLMYLFDQLSEAGWLPYRSQRDRAQLLSLHFLDRNEAPLKPDSLATGYSKAHGQPADAHRVDQVLQSLEGLRGRNVS